MVPHITQYNISQKTIVHIYKQYSAKMGICPFLANILAECPCSEIIYVHAPTLKLDFNKIEFQCET